MSNAQPPTPPIDDKDWTWVLEQPCPDCGYRSDTEPERIGVELRASVARWQAVLERAALDRSELSLRPNPTTWSPLEYAAHVRDVYELFDQRVELMITEDDPQFANWDQDQTALEKRYWESDPVELRTDLERFGDRIATTYDAVSSDQWDRTGRRSNGSSFTVTSLGRYCLHDVVHHLHDVNG